MRIKASLYALLVVSLAACSGSDDPSLKLLGSTDGGTPSDDDPSRAASESVTFGRTEPILEGRSYRLSVRPPPPRLITVDEIGAHAADTALPEQMEVPTSIHFDNDPRLAPRAINFVELGIQYGAYEVAAEALIPLACAHSIMATSEVIPAGTAADEFGNFTYALPNPGTDWAAFPIGEDGFVYVREMPDWALSTLALMRLYETPHPEDSCNPGFYWTQAMHLCVGAAYLELAQTQTPHALVVEPMAPPSSKVPIGQGNPYECVSGDPEGEPCRKLGYALHSLGTLSDTKQERDEVMRRYLKAEMRAGRPFDPRVPSRGILQTDEEYIETILPHYTAPIASYPIQADEDSATLALLAENHFLTAQDIGHRYIECELGRSTDYYPHWLDTYEHKTVSANELILGNLLAAVDGSLEAAEEAQRLIMNGLTEGLEPGATEEEHQLFWRGTTNSRLECLHTWVGLAGQVFQPSDVSAEDVDNETMFPVFPWRESSEQVERAESLIRDARINPRLIETSAAALTSALRASMRADMRYSLADVDDPVNPDEMLAQLGIDQLSLRAAALRIIDAEATLGRPIIELNGSPGMAESRPIVVGSSTTPHFYTHGAQRSSAPADPIYLYARSIGVNQGNYPTAPGGLPTFAYQSIAGGISHSAKALTQLAETFSILQETGPAQPFFPTTGYNDLLTPDIGDDTAAMAAVQQTLQTANELVPEVLWACSTGFTIFHSSHAPSQAPEAWRSEAGLQCALSGRFGDVPCNEDHYRVPYSVPPAVPGYVDYGHGALGKYVIGGILNYTGGDEPVAPGERVYFTRLNSAGQREAIVGITHPGVEETLCNYFPFGGGIYDRVNTCLAALPDKPSKPAFCCEKLPCDLKVPLEDTLQSTPEREVESSFMHYVSLAREASNRADELGEQLFRQGLELDQRAELAREELEDLCGGVVNIDRLAPKPCQQDTDCCTGDDCSARCMTSSGLSNGQRYCTNSTPSESLSASKLSQCSSSTPCAAGFSCVADSDGSSFCASSCTPGPMACGGESERCIAGPNGSTFCADACGSDSDCSIGMKCRQHAGAGRQICAPGPIDDLRSVEQCLGIGSGANSIVPAALGDKPLYAWRYPGLPACVCPTSHPSCTPPYDKDGMPNCPALVEADRDELLPAGAEPFTITETLGFGTHLSSGDAQSALACQALAELRAGVTSQGTTSERNVATVAAQKWMNTNGMAEVGGVVDPEYDSFGFLSLNVGDQPWVRTGSVFEGDASPSRFPFAPIITDPDLDALICDASEKYAGMPLQCKGLAQSGARRITEPHLIRVTQVMRLLGLAPQVPIAEHDELPNPGRYSIIDGYFVTPPQWFTTDFPGAVIHRVAYNAYMEDRLDYDDQSDEDKKDGLYVLMPQCVRNATGSWDDLIGCGEITGPGMSNTDPFKAYVNGSRNTGLWAVRNTNSKGTKEHIQRIMNGRGEGTVYDWLRQIERKERVFSDRDPSPLFPSNWDTGGRPITVAETMDALEMACLMTANPGGPQVGLSVGCDPEGMNPNVVITGPRDFPKLTSRLRCAADQIDGQLERMWVGQIPAPVAAAIRGGEVTDTVPTLRGTYAQNVAELQGAFQAVSESTRAIATQLRSFANDLTLAQSTLDTLDREGEILDWRLAADIASQVSACASQAANLDFGAGIACANAAVQIASAVAIENLQDQNLDASKRDTLTMLSQKFGDRMDSLHDAAERLLTAYTAIQTNMAALDTTRRAATRAAAKAMLADNDATGRVYNVNTSMRRNMNTLRIRYARALGDAKRMTFIARRSIEQRLGMSLTELNEDLLLVEAPSGWADSACSMTGFDYDRIRDATGGGTADSTADDFSKGYIGDYVTKLERFVESYRFKYPFNDGRDVAVVSLRDDVLGVTATCQEPGPNLLFHSADVQSPAVGEDGIQWGDVSDEGSVATLLAVSGSPRGPDLESEGVTSRLTAGTAYAFSAPTTPPDPDAHAYWGQTLPLDTGVYRLTWYERYGDTDTECTSAPLPTTPGLIADVIGAVAPAAIAYEAPTLVPLVLGDRPNVNEDFVQSCWRRWTLTVDNDENQNVLVRFGLEDEDATVVWAQPQLEAVDSQDVVADGEEDFELLGQPKPWFPTTDVLTAALGRCEDTTGENFQRQFAYGESYCEPICADGTGESCAHLASSSSLGSQCYSQIEFDITPGEIERGEIVSVARTNFNYRFSRFGINLVGTGLRDCEASSFPSSCYASGYLNYTLQHDGPYTVTNHEGDHVDVPLFQGRIEHAKALTAERFLTTPLSSADRTLMEDFWREELRGRPLQGAYTLRIYDAIDGTGQNILRMDRLEDIQLVFEYNYWTRTK